MSFQILHINGIDYELADTAGGSTQTQTSFRTGMRNGEPFGREIKIGGGRQGSLVVVPQSVFSWMIYTADEEEGFRPLPLGNTSRDW